MNYANYLLTGLFASHATFLLLFQEAIIIYWIKLPDSKQENST